MNKKYAGLDFPAWFDGKDVNEAAFCREFLSKNKLIYADNAFFTPDGRLTAPLLLKEKIYAELECCAAKNIPRTISNIVESMKLAAHTESFPPNPDEIHVQNGTLRTDGSFLAGRPEIVRSRFPIDYNPQAGKPVVWLRFLSNLLYPEDIATFQEYIGYCLIPSTKGQRMIILKGKGGEGKSRIGLVMRSLLGDSMNTTSIQKVESNRFSRADLENKLLMVDDDMDMSALSKTNYIKSIVTSECKMDMERKGVQSYQSQLYVRFLCFGNGALTALHDKSDGFFRRQIVLTTKDRPAGRADDPFLVDKLLRERESIFLWCLEGLHRLIGNNYQFTVSSKAKENMETVKRSSNNVIEFLQSEGYIRFRADSEASSKAIYEVYTRWCDDNAQKPMSANRVSSELAQNERLYNVEATNNVHVGGKRVRGFMGIEVVNPLPYEK